MDITYSIKMVMGLGAIMCALFVAIGVLFGAWYVASNLYAIIRGRKADWCLTTEEVLRLPGAASLGLMLFVMFYTSTPWHQHDAVIPVEPAVEQTKN